VADAEFRACTDMSGALLAARLSFPSGKSRRVVVFTDAAPTTASIESTLATLKDEDVEVFIKRIAPLQTPEAAILALEPTSDRAFQGEVVRMIIKTQANQDMNARLRILHRGVAVVEQTIHLKANQETISYADVEMISSGASHWQAEIIPDKDHFPLNNRISTTVKVHGQPRVLVIHRDTHKLRSFSRAMKKQGIEIDLRGARGLPDSLDALLAFDAIMLADVSATDLQPSQMEDLKRYVTDFGGGLAMLGSENSFGLGGYYKTPVEDVLPLTSRFEKEKQKPSLAMVLVIDKSGSMSGVPIELARQAAKSAAELLSAQDQIAVVGFDGNPVVICEMTSAGNKVRISDAIDTLQASGGTYLYPAMVKARDMLQNSNSRIKHMIVLTDGQTQQADHIGLTQELVDSGVTVSCVAMGEGAARSLLSQIAETGKGRYYETNDPANVPQIFTKETMHASRSAIKEDLYASVISGDHPVLSGYEKSELPMILGYVMTKSKPTAQVLMVTETGDPLLAISRFGLGMGMAYTSDLTDRWGGEWLAWSGSGKFWAQVIRGILKKEDDSGMSIRAEARAGKWQLSVKRKDLSGAAVNQVIWNAAGIDQNGDNIPLKLQQTGLGTYEGNVDLLGVEALALRLQDMENNKVKTVYWQQPYPAEYQLGSRIPAALAALPAFSAEQVRSHIKPHELRKSVTYAFVLAAMAFLTTGIVLRRI
jgi:Ca-activated chloride channel family protein